MATISTEGSKVADFSVPRSGNTGSVASARAAYLRNLPPNGKPCAALSAPGNARPVTLRGIQYPAGGNFYWG